MLYYTLASADSWRVTEQPLSNQGRRNRLEGREEEIREQKRMEGRIVGWNQGRMDEDVRNRVRGSGYPPSPRNLTATPVVVCEYDIRDTDCWWQLKVRGSSGCFVSVATRLASTNGANSEVNQTGRTHSCAALWDGNRYT